MTIIINIIMLLYNVLCLQPSLAEVVHREDFSLLPVMPSDFIREYHGVYSGETSGGMGHDSPL